MFSYKNFLILGFLLVLSACGGDGGNGGSGDDEGPEENPVQSSDTTDYRLFPVGFFEEGYEEEFAITGSNVFSNLTGTNTLGTGGSTVFDGQDAIVVLSGNEWVDDFGGEFANPAFLYYSADAEDRRYLGSMDLTTIIANIATETFTLPETAKIGESGKVATTVDNLGNVTEITWAMEASGTQGQARFAFMFDMRDAAGDPFIFVKTAYIIDPDGTRHKITIDVDDHFLDIVTNWQGDRI